MNRNVPLPRETGGSHPTPAVDVRITIIEPGDSQPQLREALQRFRYDVYVREMNRPQQHADHAAGRIEDALDSKGINLVATIDGHVVGCARVNLAWEGGLDDYDQLYGMSTSSPDYPAGVGIVTRLMVAAAHRGGHLTMQMFLPLYRMCLERGIRHGYMDCNAHLVGRFEQLGFVPHTEPREHPEYGLVQPMRLDLHDAQHLRGVASPFLPVLQQWREQRAAPASPGAARPTAS